jgi:hypothetical protein
MRIHRGSMCLLLLLASVARAATADLTSANPDAPAVEVGWRMSLRAKAGVRIAFLAPKEGDSGPLIELPAFIELHNFPGNTSVVPYELWRARIALAGGYRWRRGDWRLDALGLLEHESDHVTGPNVADEFSDWGFVALNDAALTARVRRMVRHPSFVQLTGRFHFLTCTITTTVCGAGHGVIGDRTFEMSLEGSQEFTLDGDAKWALFASLSADAWVAQPLVAPSRRISVRLGVLWRRPGNSLSLSLFGLAGNDVGYGRALDTLQAGVQLAWAPGED